MDIIVEKVAAALSVTPETVRRSRKMMFEISEEADIAKADLMEGKDIDTALLVADSDGLVVDWGLTAAEYAKLAEPVLDEMVEVAIASLAAVLPEEEKTRMGLLIEAEIMPSP